MNDNAKKIAVQNSKKYHLFNFHLIKFDIPNLDLLIRIINIKNELF